MCLKQSMVMNRPIRKLFRASLLNKTNTYLFIKKCLFKLISGKYGTILTEFIKHKGMLMNVIETEIKKFLPHLLTFSENPKAIYFSFIYLYN